MSGYNELNATLKDLSKFDPKANERAPLIGTIVARFALVRFCRMLGTLVSSGVPLVSSLRTAREAARR